MSNIQNQQADLPMVTRAAPVKTVDSEKRTVDVVFSSGAKVRRSRWVGWDTRVPYEETIVVSSNAVNLERLASGGPVLDSHNSWSTRSQVAVVEKAWIDGGEALARVRFPSPGVDEAADRMFGLVREGIVRNVSVGYSQDEVRVVEAEKKGDVEQWFVERWTPYEISFVTVPADPKAQVRSDDSRDGARVFPAVIIRAVPSTQEKTMTEAPASTPAAAEASAGADARAQAVAPASEAAALAADRKRCAEITALGAKFGIAADTVRSALESGESLDAFRGLVLSELERREPAKAIKPGGAAVAVVDPGESPADQRRAMIDGIILRALGQAPAGAGAPKIDNEARAREFANMSLLEMGAEMMGIRNAHRMNRSVLMDTLIERSMLGTSDYPLLLSAAANKFLLAQYQYQQPSYRSFSVKKTFNDFKAHNFLRVGDFPTLELLSETGEFRNGAISENREQVFAYTYGKIVSLSRQMFVNDDLSAFADLTGAAGRRVADFENSLAWSVILQNSKAGPTLSDSGALFNVNAVTAAGGHANQAATASAITVASLSAGRLAMRMQKSLDGIPLNLNPQFIVAGPAKQTEVEQLLSVNLLATQLANINPFNGGGLTRLTPVIDAYITDSAWYLFADPAVAPVFIYGYVAGYEGPRFAIDQPFRQDGLALKVVEDFGFGAIDWRPGYRNAGA
jgi:phage head maturation protease